MGFRRGGNECVSKISEITKLDMMIIVKSIMFRSSYEMHEQLRSMKDAIV